MHKINHYFIRAALAALTATCFAVYASNGSSARPRAAAAPPTTTSATIGPAGGTLTSADGRLTLTVPPGALIRDRIITIQVRDPDRVPAAFRDIEAASYYELKPHGLTFARPATVSFKLGDGPVQDETSLPDPRTRLLTAERGAPVLLGGIARTVDASGWTRVSGTLTHFSPVVITVERVQVYEKGPGESWTPSDDFSSVVSPTVVEIEGVPERLRVGETFTAEFAVRVDVQASVLDVITGVTLHTYGSYALERKHIERELRFNGQAFVGQVQYGCVSTGIGFFSHHVVVEGIDLDQGTSFEGLYSLIQLTSVVLCKSSDYRPPPDNPSPDTGIMNEFGVMEPPLRWIERQVKARCEACEEQAESARDIQQEAAAVRLALAAPDLSESQRDELWRRLWALKAECDQALARLRDCEREQCAPQSPDETEERVGMNTGETTPGSASRYTTGGLGLAAAYARVNSPPLAGYATLIQPGGEVFLGSTADNLSGYEFEVSYRPDTGPGFEKVMERVSDRIPPDYPGDWLHLPIFSFHYGRADGDSHAVEPVGGDPVAVTYFNFESPGGFTGVNLAHL